MLSGCETQDDILNDGPNATTLGGYRVYVGEAVRVVASGIPLPLTSMVAENDPPAPSDTNQDWERRRVGGALPNPVAG